MKIYEFSVLAVIVLLFEITQSHNPVSPRLESVFNKKWVSKDHSCDGGPFIEYTSGELKITTGLKSVSRSVVVNEVGNNVSVKWYGTDGKTLELEEKLINHDGILDFRSLDFIHSVGVPGDDSLRLKALAGTIAKLHPLSRC